jgi:hypothetical protein
LETKAGHQPQKEKGGEKLPDITMCKGGKCPFQQKCWRFLACPIIYQSYFEKVPYNEKSKSCDYFWLFESKWGNKRKNDLENSFFRD